MVIEKANLVQDIQMMKIEKEKYVMKGGYC